jgi:hypothetical protein
MKIIITESQLKNILNEQAGVLYPTTSYRGAEPETIRRGVQGFINLDPHEKNQILAVAALFIPYIGYYTSLGIEAYDASLYYKEGKKTEAALVLLFAALPEIGEVVSKIPGVKALGKKGMSLLAGKIAKGVKALSPVESQVVKALNLNKGLINREAKEMFAHLGKEGAHHAGKELLKHQAIASIR